ncbi:hypothetical protein OG792_20985 [Micromonospora sp. NBC_01699]|uniref:hypothetical protein n=1 Tax=Micromonospora sp. NBC_01699 TaxID=2975984 RepID=UPI002E2AFED8|nr:hypothetical protein [Micromonospora sp. NBC_01699]
MTIRSDDPGVDVDGGDPGHDEFHIGTVQHGSQRPVSQGLPCGALVQPDSFHESVGGVDQRHLDVGAAQPAGGAPGGAEARVPGAEYQQAVSHGRLL